MPIIMKNAQLEQNYLNFFNEFFEQKNTKGLFLETTVVANQCREVVGDFFNIFAFERKLKIYCDINGLLLQIQKQKNKQGYATIFFMVSKQEKPIAVNTKTGLFFSVVNFIKNLF